VQNLSCSSLLSKNLKMKIYRTIILPVLLYGCETWWLTLREERRLRVSEDSVLRVFGPKRDEVESSWNVMAHGDAWEGSEGGNWRMEWVASTLHTTSEHAVSSITTADAHTSAASRRLNWRPRRFKWTRPFRRKTKSGFCASAITFQTKSNKWVEKTT